MSEERAKQLARLLQAIDDCERGFSEIKTDYKNRMEILRNQEYALRQQILSGQMELPVEPPEAA